MKYDVIIVLGGGINDDGSIPEIPLLRLKKGVKLFQKGLSDKIIVSGKWGFLRETKPPLSEARAMKKYLISIGIPKKAIFIEEESLDTTGNAYFTKINILQPQKWRNLLLITSDFHMRRTKIIFNFILGKDYHVKYIKATSKLNLFKKISKFKLESKFIKFIGEWVDLSKRGNDKYIKNWLFSSHPAYSKKSKYTTKYILDSVGIKN